MTRREALAALSGIAYGEPVAAQLRLEIKTERIVEMRWPDANTAVAFGSLMKPFVALAFGKRFPEVVCKRCWKPDGHGRLTLVEALACSCNTYFLDLARACSLDEMARVAAAYGLPAPPGNPEAWIGLGDSWRVSPLALLRAYAELASRAPEDGPRLILRGMRESARRGTAKAIQTDVYAKTGTAPCSHHPRGNGDGFAVALFPAGAPRQALLIGLHDQPGAQAARVAGGIIGTHRQVAGRLANAQLEISYRD